jgi:hypothetical protein
VNADDLAVDACLDGHGRERLDIADRDQAHGYRLGNHRRCGHRNAGRRFLHGRARLLVVLRDESDRDRQRGKRCGYRKEVLSSWHVGRVSDIADASSVRLAPWLMPPLSVLAIGDCLGPGSPPLSRNCQASGHRRHIL